MSSPESKINNLLDRIRNPNNATIYTSSSSPSPTPTSGTMNNNGGNNTPRTTNRPILQCKYRYNLLLSILQQL